MWHLHLQLLTKPWKKMVSNAKHLGEKNTRTEAH